MVHKVERIAKKLNAVISSWPGVECILSCEASETDLLDPYFALVLDVYCSAPIPPSAERQAMFVDPGAFETSRSGEKDRFFLESLPIHIEYKRTKTIDYLVERHFDAMWLYGATGTYMLYRFVNGAALFSRSDWLSSTRQALSDINPEFWERLAEAYAMKMEHCLSDLGGAALKDDRFFYFVSLAGFMRACASALFARNRQWEPSERHMTDALMALPRLPEDFEGRWSLLLRTDASVEPSKRFQVAQLIARSVIGIA